MSDFIIPLILKKLYEETDEQHRLSYNSLMTYLENEEIPISRSSLGRKINAIRAVFPEIKQVHLVAEVDDEGERNEQYGYGVYYKKDINLSEIQTLLDMVDANRTLPQEEKLALSKSIRSLANDIDRMNLKRPELIQASSARDADFMRKTELIRKAIAERGCIRFHHYHYNKNLELIKAENEVEIVSPALIQEHDDHTYLVAVTAENNRPTLRFFRLDLIGDMERCHGDYVDIRRIPGYEANINLGRLMMNSPAFESADNILDAEFVCDETFLDTLVKIVGKDIQVDVLAESKLNWFHASSLMRAGIYENIYETPGDKPGWHLQSDPSVPLLKVTIKMSRVEALELASRYPLDVVLIRPTEWKDEMVDKLLKVNTLLYEDVARAMEHDGF